MKALVALGLRNRFVVLSIALAVIVGGIASYLTLDVEAYPNPVPPLVEVIAQPPGASAEDVERYVTRPLEIGLAAMPGLDHVRSQSQFGLSDVKCYFKWGVPYKDARQEVINRLQFIDLPPNVEARISPWNAIGEIYRYIVRGPDYSLTELKTTQDWVLARQFKQVDGVIDTVSFGGLTKQYQVAIDPYRLRAHNVTLDTLIASIANANQNVGGQRLFIGEQSYDVRGVGMVSAKKDVEHIVLSETNGTPILVKQIAEVSDTGHAPRLGIVGRDDQDDVVQGTILMRYGAETSKTLQGIYQRVDVINRTNQLPPGVTIDRYYDRGDLVKVTTRTVRHNVIEGMILVTIVLFVFLGHARAALVTAINIPLALFCAFIGMVVTGTPANLISLGAVDFGIVIDSTVIMVENIFRHLGSERGGALKDRIAEAAGEVGRPMFFSTLIIAIAFLPLFTMTGVAGVIFSPMAHTYAFAVGGAIFLALSLTPVLSATFLRTQAEERESFFVRALFRVYRPVIRWGLRRPLLTCLLALVPVVVAVLLLSLLGSEFMPKLEEGNFWIRATLPTSISLDQSARYAARMRRIIRGCPSDEHAPCVEAERTHPEVLTVVSQTGRPDDGTDPSGFYNIELFAPLKPFDEWQKGLDKPKLTDQLSHELEEAFPGVVFNFSQIIRDNVEEAVSGVKGENSVKVIGPDLESNEKNAAAIIDVMEHVNGVRDLGMINSIAQPRVTIVPNRESAARYGLNTGNVAAVIEAAIGGRAITRVYEGDKFFELTVRWLPSYRDSVAAIRAITVSTPDGSSVPLGQIASIKEEVGPSVIYHEDGERYSPVKFSVRGRDLASTIKEAQSKIGSSPNIKLPYGTRLDWAGEIKELSHAMGRLRIIVPITLLLIALLVQTAVKSFIDTAIVLLNIPIACAGGIIALLVTGIHFSVSAAMGFISIFGIAIQDAILVVTYFQRLRQTEGLELEVAATEAAFRRFRAAMMTTLVAMLGLLPAALSHDIGSETQRPLATVVIGGALMIAVVTRMSQPAAIVLLHRRFVGGPAGGDPRREFWRR